MALPSLLLLRHGIAEEPAEHQSDADRSLTAAGRRRTRAVLERAVAMGLGVERLMASPLMRARQTGELAVAAGLAPSLELATALAPGADPLPLLSTWLQAASVDGAPPALLSLALVGHEPDLSDLAALLLGAPAGSLRLRKAGMALLQWAPAAAEPEPEPGGARSVAAGSWQLRLLLAPRILLG
jgi:phosphohistidine phosphatase